MFFFIIKAILSFSSPFLYCTDDDEKKIVYDIEAISKLLDRTQEGQEEKEIAMNEYLSSFKVASYQVKEGEQEVQKTFSFSHLPFLLFSHLIEKLWEFFHKTSHSCSKKKKSHIKFIFESLFCIFVFILFFFFFSPILRRLKQISIMSV